MHMEQSYAQQRAKQHWLRQMDDNTKFFYASIKGRRMVNTIRSVKHDNGTLISNMEEVKTHTLSYFQQLLNQDRECIPPNFEPKVMLSNTDCSLLSAPFSGEEIKRVVMNAPKNKSPGPDGFTSEFFQACWHIVGENVTEAALYLLNGGSWLNQASNTFISLIPKNECADKLDQFRPISLCNSFYKIIAKVLANRLQQVMPKLISPNQAAFIK